MNYNYRGRGRGYGFPTYSQTGPSVFDYLQELQFRVQERYQEIHEQYGEPSNVLMEDYSPEDDYDNLNTETEEEDNFSDNEIYATPDLLLRKHNADFGNDQMAQFQPPKNNRDAFNKPEVREVFKRLSGAGKRRYKALIADNVPWEKALEMCQKRWSQLPAGANPKKRARMAKLAKRTSKRLKEPHSHNNMPFAKNRKYPEVCIQNVTEMTKNQSDLLRRDLISKIMQLGNAEGPRFVGYSYRSGVLLVSCKDKQSQKWLINKLPQIEPWPGAKLCGSATILPNRPTILHALLPLTEISDASHAFTLFRIQNRGLNTEDWVLKSSQSVSGKLIITVSVDLRSVEALKEAKYRACLGFQSIRFYRGYASVPNETVTSEAPN